MPNPHPVKAARTISTSTAQLFASLAVFSSIPMTSLQTIIDSVPKIIASAAQGVS